MDIASIGAVLSSIKSATDLVKVVRESSKSLSEAETKLKLADLISTLADVKLGVAAVQDELAMKNARIRELELLLELKEKLKFVDPCYWMKVDEVAEPYCQPCYDGTKKLSHLIEKSKGFFSCAVCGSSFNDKDARHALDQEGSRQAAAFRNRRRVPLA